MKPKIFSAIIILVILAGVIIYLIYNKHKKSVPDNSPAQTVEKSNYEENSSEIIMFFYPNESLTQLNFVKQKAPYKFTSDIEKIKYILSKLFSEPENSEDVNIFPEGFTYKNVYLNKNHLYIDFSSDAVGKLNWGSASEQIFLNMLRKTIKNNFNTIKFIRLLIDGKVSKTFNKNNGGHIDITVPIIIN